MYAKGFIDKALGNLDKTLEEDPGFFKPYHLKGILLAMQKKKDEAIVAYAKAVELAPNSIELKMDFAKFYLNNELKDEALKLYQNILENAPDSPDGHYGLGLIFVQENKLDEALQELVMAKDIFQKQVPKEGEELPANPNRGHVHYQLGLIYKQKGDAEQAFVEFTQACAEYDVLLKKLSAKAAK